MMPTSADDVPPEPRRSLARRLGPWLAAWAFGAALSEVSTTQALTRYQEFRSGWSWDLAYYNQWFWAVTRGDGRITVRPVAAYGIEGPSVWKMNYLAPVRLVLVPLYVLFPDPRTLLVCGNVVFWWVVPAAFGLVRSESRSDALALSAAALVPFTPLLWPLAWNDFRELQLALPFALWAIQGVRGRDVRLSALGIGGLLACRQEFAVVVASLAILPPRRPEDLRRTLRWSLALAGIGAAWFFVGFFGYLAWTSGLDAPGRYIRQFLGPKATPGQTLATATELLALGLGGWAVLACLAPRMAVLAVPWIWSLCGGHWTLRYLATVRWHEVRYTAPAGALVLAAGLIGYARLGGVLLRRRGGGVLLAAAWLLVALGGLLGLRDLTARLDHAPRPIAHGEARALWSWIERVGPDDGVFADYAVAAPLSTRRWLYSYGLPPNLPEGFPRLAPQIRWIFLGKRGPDPRLFVSQRFARVHRGPAMMVLRRAGPGAP